MDKLSDREIKEKLATLQNWQRQDAAIERVFVWKDFVQAMQFVNKVAELAEQASHHPDISIVYNKVSLRLSTHDAGGLTVKDFSLAEAINKITM